jgi:CRISPR/Cas system-associated exonuclease Cas4 (RecB family)
LRRRLAELGPFAGVRFEALPRIAELLGAGHLAAAGRSPLARPIGDYVAEQVARESQGALREVADLPGYARALRKIFRRLRSGGIHGATDVPRRHPGHLNEVLRLYDRFREKTSKFYDDEDLLEAAAAAVRSGRDGALADIGEVYVVPPGAQSAGAVDLLGALKERTPSFIEVDEATAVPEVNLVLAPDPASEAREVVREVISALKAGKSLHEVAVFHGADPAYRRLLGEAFEAANVPSVPLPGVPLADTRAGRGVLALALLPDRDFSRSAVMDLFSIAPLRSWLPGRNADVRAQPTVFDRISRKAGITHGAERWSNAIQALIADCDQRIAENKDGINDARARAATYERERADNLLDVIEPLIARLAPLRESQPAESFIKRFKAIVSDYFQTDAADLEGVVKEIDQLGTVDAVGGSFSLASFAQALGANLESAFTRSRHLGDGVIVADYRMAAGLQFKQVVLCGAYQGALPSGAGSDVLIDDGIWEKLREHYPHIEDARARVERAEDAARRAIASAGSGRLVWSSPMYEPGGTRAYYPSPLMVAAAANRDSAITTASDLRQHPESDDWLRRASSPLAVMLRGQVVDDAEVAVRLAISQRLKGEKIDSRHPRWFPVSMLRARRSDRFTVWDGNLSELADDTWLELQKAVSPTSLEDYGVCGFRYLCKSLLKLNVVEEPEEREVIDPAERGNLIHRVLERFFKAQKENGRPALNEAWTLDDLAYLLRLLDDQLAIARQHGKTGLDVYASHDARSMRADLDRFLAADTAFRRETGAVPNQFEVYVPEVEIAGVKLRGKVDRIDRTPDGRCAWVIDYKTGNKNSFEKIASDPLVGGTKLQLPVYLEAVRGVEEAHASYWFTSRKGNFEFVEYQATTENRVRFERTVDAIVTGIRSGAFPAVPGDENEHYGMFDNCRYCDFDRICSRRRDYEFGAKEGELAPWQAVAIAARPGEQS